MAYEQLDKPLEECTSEEIKAFLEDFTNRLKSSGGHFERIPSKVVQKVIEAHTSHADNPENNSDESVDFDILPEILSAFLSSTKNAGSTSTKIDNKPTASHQIGLSKVFASASDPAVYEDGGVYVDVSGKNESEVLAMLALTYEGDGTALSVTTSRQITEFDKQVANAVASMFAAGNRVVSPAQVAAVVYGKKNLGPTQINAVDTSMEKQQRTYVTIEGTGELRGRPTAGGSLTLKLRGYMLPTRVLEYADMANGMHGKAYELLDTPIFYQHDKEVQQITAVPQRLIEAISKDVRMNERAVIIRGYLTERIARAKNAGKKIAVAHKHITYQKIYDRTGIREDRKERQRVRETVHKMLDAMVAEGFLKSWHEYQDSKTKGKAKTGVEIEV